MFLDLDMALIKTILNGFPDGLRTHCCNVCYLSIKIAEEIGFSSNQINLLVAGALLHDIGKCCINESILNKQGRLTGKEFEIIKQHTVMGVKIINWIRESSAYQPVVLYHHERWDGNGYEGLAKEEIPLLARIVTIADAFDAMTSSRPYHKPKIITDALKELNLNKGTQFAPDLVELFELSILKLLKNLHYRQSFDNYLKKIF